MALAIRFEGLIANGTVSDYSELAVLDQVSRARITQITNFNLPAPELQETLLFLPQVETGRDMLTLANMQTIALESNWGKQRKNWNGLCTYRGQHVLAE